MSPRLRASRSIRIISRGCEVVGAFLWSGDIDEAPDGFPEPVGASLRRLARQGLQLCKGDLDRIEIGPVGREKPEPRLWLERLSMITVSPGRRVGARIGATRALSHRASGPAPPRRPPSPPRVVPRRLNPASTADNARALQSIDRGFTHLLIPIRTGDGNQTTSLKETPDDSERAGSAPTRSTAKIFDLPPCRIQTPVDHWTLGLHCWASPADPPMVRIEIRLTSTTIAGFNTKNMQNIPKYQSRQWQNYSNIFNSIRRQNSDNTRDGTG